MRRNPTKIFLAIITGFVAVSLSSQVHANKLDLSAARFISCTTDGTDCRADNRAFEHFMAEYAFGVSPKLLSPASTLGYSGFYLGIETSVMGIPSGGKDAFNGSNYNDSRWRIGTANRDNSVPPPMFFPTIHVRKGLPWSIEVGSSISYLAKSELVALGGEIKWSLFEGYSKGFLGALPDVAVRGAVNRIIGQTDVDMTSVGADASISYPFGIAGAISIEPYAGYQYMWTIIRPEPMSLFNNQGQLAVSGSNSWDVTEADMSGPNLTRQKIFGGFVFRYELLTLTMDWTVGLPSSWKTEQHTAFPITAQNYSTVKVKVATQLSYSVGVGIQF